MRPPRLVFGATLACLALGASRLPAWESQLLPYNGGSGQYEEATVNFAGRDWRLLDYSYVGYKLGAQPLATGVPCAVFPVAGGGDISAALQTAITNAQTAGGGVVRIPAGSFTMSGPVYVTADNISIEGAGSNATFITVPNTYTQTDARYEGLFTFGKAAGGWNKGWIDRGPELTAVTVTVQSGQMFVDVTSTSGIAVNDWIVLRQYFWPGLSNPNSSGTWSSWTGWPSPTTSANRSFSFTYLRQVLGIAGLRLSLDAPIPWTLDPADNPIRIQKVNPSGGFAMRQNVGVSGLSVSFADNFNDASYTPARPEGAAVHFEGVRDGWVYGLVIRNFPRFAIQGESAARITVLDTQVIDCQDDGGDGYGYGYHWNESQQILVKRCYAERVRHAYLSQHPLSNFVVFTQDSSREARQGDDSHHSFVHGYLFDDHRSYEGSGARSVQRGSTSSNAYETCGSAVYWNFKGDGGRGGGADGGSIFLNPSVDGWGMVIGGPGGAYKVFDGDTAAGDLIPPAAGLQVGPTLGAPGLGSKDRNALYEGIGQAGLTPASLYETQLLRRLGSVPAAFAASCSASFSAAPVAPSLYTGPGTLVYDSDHLGWVPALGGGCDLSGTSAGGTHTNECWADDPAHDHTGVAGGESAEIRVTGVDWNILMDFTGTTQPRGDFTAITFWAWPDTAGIQLRLYVAQREDGTYNDLNAASTLITLGAANTWTQVTVPLSTFGGAATPFNKLQLRSYSTNAGAKVWLDDIILAGGATPTPTASPSASATATRTPSATPTASPSATATSTPSATATPSPSPSPTSAQSPTDSPSPTPAQSPTDSPSPSPVQSPTDSPSPSPVQSPTDSPSPTPAQSPTVTPSQTDVQSATATPSASPSPTPACPGAGYLGSGTVNNVTDDSGYIDGNLWNLPVDGVLTAIQFFVASGSGQVRVAAYADAAGAPGALLAEGGPQSFGPGIQSLSVPAVPVPAGPIWFFLQTEPGVVIGYNPGAGYEYYQPAAFGAFPPTLSGGGYDNWALAMLGVFCPGPSPTVTPTASPTPSASPTATATASGSATPTGTGSATPSDSPTPGGPTATSTPSASPGLPPPPSGTRTSTPTPSPSPGAVTATATPTCPPTSTNGDLRVIVFADLNGNGIDDGEPRLPNITVRAWQNVSCFGPVTNTAETDAIGPGDSLFRPIDSSGAVISLDLADPDLPAGSVPTGTYPAGGGSVSGVYWSLSPGMVPVVKIGVWFPASPTPTPSPSRTAPPSPSPTATATPSNTPVTTATASPSPAPTPGELAILDAAGVPNPGPKELRVKLGRAAQTLRVRLYSPAYVLLADFEAGPLPQDWSTVPLPPDFRPVGLVFARLEAHADGRVSLPVPPLRLYYIR